MANQLLPTLRAVLPSMIESRIWLSGPPQLIPSANQISGMGIPIPECVRGAS